MNARHHWIFALAGLGLAIAAPVHAAPNFMGDTIIVARRDRAEEPRRDPRDFRRDERRDERRDAWRGRDGDPQGYGYGYERRQQRQFEEDNRARGRR